MAFLGTHVPLLATVVFLLFSSPVPGWPAPNVLVVLLIATLAGTGATIWALRSLLAPVRLASASPRVYLDDKRMPDLPIVYPDGAGKLMTDVQYAVESIDSTVRWQGAAQPRQEHDAYRFHGPERDGGGHVLFGRHQRRSLRGLRPGVPGPDAF